ncbi:MAG: tetratricopeptide repeat protein [Blastocatellales bacterium]|nr:tetratricopeptide repeat protein [Blastocatellales bacterium]
MSQKKRKSKKGSSAVSPIELLRTADSRIERGEIDAAFDDINKAARELAPRPAPPGKKISVPPHIVAARQELGRLRARALAARARTCSDPHLAASHLKDAVESDPAAVGYRIALGAARLQSGKLAEALLAFAEARKSSPDHPLLARAFAIASAYENSDSSAIASTGSQLLEGLAQAMRGEWASAGETLGCLPQISSHPSRREAAQLATQLYYSGLIAALDGRIREALGDWAEAARLSREHALGLPWVKRLVEDLRNIAADCAPESARECWRMVLSLSPGDREAQAHLTAADRAQALEYWRADRTLEAARIWEAILKVAPEEHGIRRNHALALEKLELTADAAREWKILAREQRRRLKNSPPEAESMERLIVLEKHLVKLMITAAIDPGDIFNEIEATTTIAPDNDELALWASETLLEIGRVQPALRHLDAIEKRRGASAGLLLRKGILLDILERHSEARHIFDRAFKLEPDNPIVRNTMLLFLGEEAVRAANRRNLPQAVAYCERQLSINPDYAAALAHLGHLYYSLGREKDAKNALSRLAAIEPRTAERLTAAGTIYLHVGVKKEAAALFKEAMSLSPDPETIINIGDAYCDRRMWKEAMRYYDIAVQKGANLELLAHVIISLFEKGRKREGQKYLDEAFRRDPEHPLPYMIKGIDKVSSLSPIDIIFNPGVLKEAIEIFETAETKCIGHPEYSKYLESIRDLRAHVAAHPMLQAATGDAEDIFGFPFDEDDLDFLSGDDSAEDFNAFIDRPPRRKKPRRRR